MIALWYYYKEHAVDNMVLSDESTHQLIQSIFTGNAYKLMLTRSPLSGFLSKQSSQQEKQEVSPPHHVVVSSISDDPTLLFATIDRCIVPERRPLALMHLYNLMY